MIEDPVMYAVEGQIGLVSLNDIDTHNLNFKWIPPSRRPMAGRADSSSSCSVRGKP
jgi:hypothetical protein